MSKDTKSRIDDEKMPEFHGETMLEQFENWVETHNSVRDIILFLKVKSAECVAKSASGALSEDDKDDILEFANLFYEEYDAVTSEARRQEFDGREPIVLALARGIADERWKKDMEDTVNDLNDFEKSEASSLARTLFNFRYKRRYVFSAADVSEDIVLPRTISKRELELVKEELEYMAARVIHDRGSIVGHFYREDSELILGIAVLSNGKWMPLPAEEIAKAYCMTPSGVFIQPEEFIRFISFDRKEIEKC